MMRAALYLRVSSDRQREARTIEAQIPPCEALARSLGFEVVEHYVDDGVCGAEGHLAERTGVQRMLADARRSPRPWDAVLAFSLDRLSRSDDLIERYAVLGAIQRAGVHLATVTDGRIDLADMGGRILLHVKGESAADERRKIRERTSAGRARAIAEGRLPAGPPPFGLRFARGAGWQIDPERAAVVREIFVRVAAGESCSTIAHDLERRGVPRPRGGRWAREMVWKIARSTAYRGCWTVDRARGLTVEVPPIVGSAEWDAADSALLAHRRRQKPRAKHVRLGEGLMVCALCGGRIGISSGPRPPGQDRGYYVCGRRRRPGGDGRCMLPMRRVAAVDARLWGAVAATIVDPLLLQEALDHRADGGGEVRDLGAELAGAESELAAVDARLDGVAASFAGGEISARGWATARDRAEEARARLRRRIATLRAELADEVSRAAAVAAIAGTVDDLRRRIPDAPPDVRAEIVRILIPPGALVLDADGSLSGVISVPVSRCDSSGYISTTATNPISIPLRCA